MEVSGPDNINWAVMMVLRSRYPPAPALAPTAWSSHRADLPMRMVAAKLLNLGLGAHYLMGREGLTAGRQGGYV
jgi:hypothetical protein